MPYNVTIDNISPLITYQGRWRDAFNFTVDPYYDRYLNNTFRSTWMNGAQASFQFNGTAVYIFGAMRDNHGNYTVQVDDEQPRPFNGSAPYQPDGTDGVYQVPIYARADLVNGLHNVILTNRGEGDKLYVDIDFVTWTSNDEVYPTNRLDDGEFNYTPSDAWGNSSSYIEDHYDKTVHLTNYTGASASLTFEGTGIYLYGSTHDNRGAFAIALNDHSWVVMNGSTNGYHSQVLLYYADGLGPGKHNLTVINTDTEGKFLDIDYVDIVQPASSPTSTSRPIPTANLNARSEAPMIAGVVCGVVSVLAVAAVVVWYFVRRRKLQSGLIGLANETKPYIASPPAGYVPSSGRPGWSGANYTNPSEPWLDVTHRRAYIRTKSNDSSPYHRTTRSVLPPEQHSGPSVVPVLNAPVNVRTPALNRKDRTVMTQNTGGRGERSNNAPRETRIQVSDRSQDWSINSSESSDYETTEMLPPDYHQVTEPAMPPRRV